MLLRKHQTPKSVRILGHIGTIWFWGIEDNIETQKLWEAHINSPVSLRNRVVSRF